ncbi:hypothetical protein [Maribacter sp. R77961]|uniref:hypothetical protein n=1 Tax=Maribacter sp. R77961 TaxID=3093871 RepID=UPI0037C84A95
MKIKNRFKFKKWRKYLFEFLSIFLAVTLAFLLDRWNDKRKDEIAENRILTEIYKGLERDSLDIVNDKYYYKVALRGTKYFNRLFDGEIVEKDSLLKFYFFLTRESVVVQNKSGYESLKSKGLETIKNDSLRSAIISLYEVNYDLNRKFNEEYDEYKFMSNYFHPINNAIAPNFEYDAIGNIIGIKLPLQVEEKKRFLLKSYLWKIAVGKQDRYDSAEISELLIGDLRKNIKAYLKELD